MRFEEKTLLAKGKRGVAFTARLDGRVVLLKSHNPESAVNTIANEASFLKRLNVVGVGPRFIAFEDDTLVREFVDGVRIGEFLGSCSREEASSVVMQVLEQCRRMDALGINKLEMTNPYKHVLVVREKGGVRAVMIDFERCRDTLKPKNVTQFCQYLARESTVERLRACGLAVDPEAIVSLGAAYKKEGFSDEAYQRLVSLFA